MQAFMLPIMLSLIFASNNLMMIFHQYKQVVDITIMYIKYIH